MPTVLREGEFTVRIFTRDHDPPHVHVVHPDGVVRFTLGDERTAPAPYGQTWLPERTAWRALRLVERNQPFLREAWRRIHGS